MPIMLSTNLAGKHYTFLIFKQSAGTNKAQSRSFRYFTHMSEMATEAASRYNKKKKKNSSALCLSIASNS